MCEAENFKQVPKSWLKTDAGHTPKDTESVLDLRFYRHEDCTFTVYASGFRSRTAGDTCHAQNAPLQKNVSSEDSSRTPLSACPVPGFRDGHRGIGHVFQDPGESLLPLYPQTGLAVLPLLLIHCSSSLKLNLLLLSCPYYSCSLSPRSGKQTGQLGCTTRCNFPKR